MGRTPPPSWAIFAGVAIGIGVGLASCVVVTGTYDGYARGGELDGGGGSSASGGSGGSGGSNLPCTDAKQCPIGSDCLVAICKAGQCATAFASKDQPTVAQTIGDCKTRVCDGVGQVTHIPDDGDLPNDGNVCTTETCQNGNVVSDFAPSTTSCGAGGPLHCDGGGKCIGCTTSGDCGEPATCQTVSCTGAECVFANATEGQTCGLCKVCNGGVCQNQAAATPSAACVAGPACGNTGNCDGNGACAIAPQGFVCSSNCQGNVSLLGHCDGTGNCNGGSPVDCGAYLCVQGVGCKSSCSANQDCAASFNCTPGKTCGDCTSCGDWLAGTKAAGLCNGLSCSLYDTLVADCCQGGVCQSSCAENGLDLCAGPNNGCFSTEVSMNCMNCLINNPTCNGDLNACEVDDGH